jgi:hypothetical protein
VPQIKENGEVSLVGCVIRKYENNRYEGSSFMFDAWCYNTCSVVSVCYDSTRASSTGTRVEADATPEVLTCVAAYNLVQAQKLRIQIAREGALFVTEGKQVIVVRGRKVPKGTTGEVVRINSANFGAKRTYSAMIRTTSGDIYWTNITNLEPVHEDFAVWDWVFGHIHILLQGTRRW